MVASGISSENSTVTASTVIASDVCKIQNNNHVHYMRRFNEFSTN